jgi:hypothetical protein
VQLYFATDSIAGDLQCSIGNTEGQTLYARDSDPLPLMTAAHPYFARTVLDPLHLGTSQAPFNRAGPQHQGKNLLMLHPETRLCDRFGFCEFNSHSFS